MNQDSCKKSEIAQDKTTGGTLFGCLGSKFVEVSLG